MDHDRSAFGIPLLRQKCGNYSDITSFSPITSEQASLYAQAVLFYAPSFCRVFASAISLGVKTRGHTL